MKVVPDDLQANLNASIEGNESPAEGSEDGLNDETDVVTGAGRDGGVCRKGNN